MSQEELRRSYQYNHVLIDSDRILAPQFADAVVFLSGAQIELVRNVSLYLNRRDTYVKDSEVGYYMMPSDEDFDDILAIVADLEETLMGNPNTIWGYNDRYNAMPIIEGIGAGYTIRDLTEIPEDEVWVIQAAQASQTDGTPRYVSLSVFDGTNSVGLAFDETLAQGELLQWSGNVVLKHDDTLRAIATDLPTGQYLLLAVWGYKMKVPA